MVHLDTMEVGKRQRGESYCSKWLPAVTSDVILERTTMKLGQNERLRMLALRATRRTRAYVTWYAVRMRNCANGQTRLYI